MDFLGNPVGLVSDVASGVAVMIDSQDVVGLVRDVTHGMSDTTSKVDLCPFLTSTYRLVTLFEGTTGFQ